MSDVSPATEAVAAHEYAANIKSLEILKTHVCVEFVDTLTLTLTHRSAGKCQRTTLEGVKQISHVGLLQRYYILWSNGLGRGENLNETICYTHFGPDVRSLSHRNHWNSMHSCVMQLEVPQSSGQVLRIPPFSGTSCTRVGNSYLGH